MARRSACKYIANSIDYYILSFPQRLWGNLLFDEVKGGSSNCDTLIPVVAMYHSKSPDNIKELVFSSLLEVDGKCPGYGGEHPRCSFHHTLCPPSNV